LKESSTNQLQLDWMESHFPQKLKLYASREARFCIQERRTREKGELEEI
jgi:hypothetical protein